MKNYALIASALMIAVSVLPLTAAAETITKRTVVTPEPVLGATEYINLDAFDLNNDGILTRKEIGTRLFYLYDADGNEVIDNIEFDQPRMLTLSPMKREKFFSIDFNDDGITDVANYTEDSFVRKSMLSRFDGNKNGLSAKEFLGTWYTKPDTDKSHFIELDEWKQVYTAAVKGRINDQETYNR